RRHGEHGGDDAVDDQRRVPPPHRDAPLAGPRLHAGLRSRDLPARGLRRRGDARLHAPRADVAADDPPRLRGPRALDRRAVPVRPDLPALARRPLPPFGEIVRGEAEEGATTIMTDLDTLARELLAGSTRALARGLTWVESGGERAEALVARLYPRTGRAHVVGLTGAPGSGKSTLARALARGA